MLCRLIKEICEDLKFPYIHLSRWLSTSTAAAAMQTNFSGLMYHAIKDNKDLLVVKIGQDRYAVHPHGVLRMARRKGRAIAMTMANRIHRRLLLLQSRTSQPKTLLPED